MSSNADYMTEDEFFNGRTPDGETFEERLLEDLSTSNSEESADTELGITEYLASTINFDIPKAVITRILLDRDVDVDSPLSEIGKDKRKLCTADVYVWACMGVSRRDSTTDKDNGWSHTEGGYTLSSEDKNILLKKANAIYEEYGEQTVGKIKVKITSHGIMRADNTLDGYYRSRKNY